MLHVCDLVEDAYVYMYIDEWAESVCMHMEGWTMHVCENPF